MPTTLSGEEIVSLFEVLDVPYNDSYQGMDGMGSISSVALFPYILNARQAILNYLDGIGGTAKETRLKARLAEWDGIASYTGSMTQGGAGNSSGLNYSFREQRDRIRDLVVILVPFLQYHLIVQRQSQSQNSMFVPFNRA